MIESASPTFARAFKALMDSGEIRSMWMGPSRMAPDQVDEGRTMAQLRFGCLNPLDLSHNRQPAMNNVSGLFVLCLSISVHTEDDVYDQLCFVMG